MADQKEITLAPGRGILSGEGDGGVFMTNSEIIAQLEGELKSLKAALEKCPKGTDPALVASLKKAIATLERIIADLKSGQKP
ncbi:MAG: hypothetical protein WBM24_19950 [Candidatus Sulfotelmatobacter sp.]